MTSVDYTIRVPRHAMRLATWADERRTPAPLDGKVALLRASLDHANQGLLVLGGDLRIDTFNVRFGELTGLGPAQLRVGVSIETLLLAADAAAQLNEGESGLHAAWLTRFAARMAGQIERTLPNGLTVLIRYFPIEHGGWVLTYEDVTEARRVKKALHEQNERFNAALTNTPHGLCMFDRDNRLILCNPAYRRLYALPAELVQPGTTRGAILDYRKTVGNGPLDPSSYFDVIATALERGMAASRRVDLDDGRTIQITHNPMAGGGYVATHEDVTATIRAEAQVRFLAAHDALTGLPNRTALRATLETALLRAGRGQGLAIHCLDLDAFKAVNDTLGHAIGDRLLHAAGERMKSCLRGGDCLARLGGDEFVVVQFLTARAEEAEALAQRLIGAVASAPFDIEGHRAIVGLSIGIAICPGDGWDAETLLRSADRALYRAKAGGKGTFRFFKPEMDQAIQARRVLQQELRAAIEAGQFELHYQPLVDAETLAITGLEALVRWAHPERGVIQPASFIPLAEESGLMVPLGDWVIRRACAEAAQWPDDIQVAVNISPVQFKSGDLLHTVRSALDASGLPARRLELEITESVVLIDNEATLATLHQLRDAGVSIALDDFGTGFSSLSYLRQFPFEKLKIDRSFIQELGEGSAGFVKAVCDLARALGMRTTAEGVESAEQLRGMRQHGCTHAQGFFFSLPQPSRDVARMLAVAAGPSPDL